MAVFGGMTLTNKGLVLQGKAQAGAELNYTRIAVGDGSLSGQSVPALNGLISLKKNLPISRMRPQPPNKAVIGATLSNADITTGFFFREIGVFAQDPDVGEILYAYANAGVTADYIAAGGGSDIIEKAIDCVVIVGTAANITATIDDSLVFALQTDLDAVAAAKVDKVSGKGLSTNDYTTTEKTKLAGITTGAGGAGSATDTVIGNRTIVDTTAPASDTGTITSLLSGLAFQIKSITGAGWKTASTMTIAAIKALLDAATNAATASTLMKRDASGRAQVAAPSAAADIARKDTVDAAITTAANDASTKAAAAQAAAINAAATDATTKANAAAAASVPLTQKGAAGGVVPLNSSVKIDEIYLPDSIVGQVEYQSTWNASTNVPALPSAAAAKGWYYVVATAGTYSSIDFQVGDWVISNGTAWQKVDNTDAVPTVFGRTGNVVAAANDYTWAQINKAISSLADLATRSAGDLNSGTLPAARLPAISGDITIPVGGGAAAITAGAIVDADINSAAQINATKIGTAGITNTEFGYLDGVTGNIQTQLNNRPQQTTADITYYVRTDGNDANNGLANTAAGAFKTINKAVSMIPTVVDHTVSINVAAGTYSETVNVMGRRGAGSITIVGIGTTTFVKSVTAFGVERLSIYNLTATDATQIGFYIQYGGFVTLSACVTTVASSADGFNISFQHGVMTSCVVSNKTGAAISVNSGVLTVDNCTGTSNVIAFYGDNSAIIHTKGSTVPAGSSYVGAATTINPWGDNTRNNRSVASATPSATQSVPTTTWTKLAAPFGVEGLDFLGEYDPSLARFTARAAGVYSIIANVNISNPNIGVDAQLRFAKNGSLDQCIGRGKQSSAGDLTVCGSMVTELEAGQNIEFYLYHNQGSNVTISNDGNYTFFRIVRVA